MYTKTAPFSWTTIYGKLFYIWLHNTWISLFHYLITQFLNLIGYDVCTNKNRDTYTKTTPFCQTTIYGKFYLFDFSILESHWIWCLHQSEQRYVHQSSPFLLDNNIRQVVIYMITQYLYLIGQDICTNQNSDIYTKTTSFCWTKIYGKLFYIWLLNTWISILPYIVVQLKGVVSVYLSLFWLVQISCPIRFKNWVIKYIIIGCNKMS